MRFPEFPEFTVFNKTSAPFGKNSTVLFTLSSKMVKQQIFMQRMKTTIIFYKFTNNQTIAKRTILRMFLNICKLVGSFAGMTNIFQFGLFQYFCNLM